MPFIRPLAPLAAAALLGLGLAACGSSSDSSTSSSSTPATSASTEASTAKTTSTASTAGAKTVKVGESEWKITPTDGKATAGNVVLNVSNTGQVPHQLEVEGNGLEEQKTAVIDPGGSAKLAVKLKPGKYEWYCPIPGHKEQGMEGTLTVQ
jgi:uncharacterized cupredoxin-like copper-binding protein